MGGKAAAAVSRPPTRCGAHAPESGTTVPARRPLRVHRSWPTGTWTFPFPRCSWCLFRGGGALKCVGPAPTHSRLASRGGNHVRVLACLAPAPGQGQWRGLKHRRRLHRPAAPPDHTRPPRARRAAVAATRAGAGLVRGQCAARAATPRRPSPRASRSCSNLASHLPLHYRHCAGLLDQVSSVFVYLLLIKGTSEASR